MRRFDVTAVVSSTRARILIGALALLAGTIAVTVLADRAVLLARLDDRIDRGLAQEVEEFRRLAGGVDPDTGEPFGDDVEAIFDTFFTRNVPGDDEVVLSLYRGQPFARSANAPYPIEDLDDLVGAWAAVTGSTLRTDSTPGGELRSLAVPLLTSDATISGTFVVGRFPAAGRAEVDEAIRVAATAGAITFALASLLAWGIAGRVLAPLRALAAATTEIGEDDLSPRIPVRGSGELADLSRNFNAMLDRVDDAFASQRAFLDDAGHELRTPITVVRGHLELLADNEELPGPTRALLLDELDRMSRIVEDLLTLAKSERRDFVVPSPVDLGDLTNDVVDKARPLARRNWEVQPDDLAVLDIDRQRIVQAWMNLIRNAIQHTDDGDRITVFSRRDGDHVELGVSDTGEGVAADDRERIFERFGRGRSARRTRSDGAGLGLAIASAVARSHGGTIEQHDTPGGGATFVLRLPIDPAHHPPPIEVYEPWLES